MLGQQECAPTSPEGETPPMKGSNCAKANSPETVEPAPLRHLRAFLFLVADAGRELFKSQNREAATTVVQRSHRPSPVGTEFSSVVCRVLFCQA